MTRRLLFLAICLAPAAFGQFSLAVLDGSAERPAPAAVDLGAVYPTESASLRFRVRNASSAPAALSLLAANGTGFSLSGVPALPVGLAPQEALDFTVVFQAGAPATYSASLDTEGASVLLTAQVLPRLTYQVDTLAGPRTLSAAAVDFGSVEPGASVTRHFTVTNVTGLVLEAPAIGVDGGAFVLPGATPAGEIFQPGDSAGFDVVFQPGSPGTATGTLAIGDRTYALTGSEAALPLPHPQLAIDLAQPRSGQQGTVAVNFDSAALVDGTGTLTLDFQPLAPGAADPAIQLGVVGPSLPFGFAAGDTQAHFGDLSAVAFQTGTTAGTLVFTAALGEATDQKSIAIPAAPVTVASATGLLTANSIELRIAGFDNTRTVGKMVYTFYDAAGSAIAAIPADSSADFAAWFAGSGDGGNFLLRSIFPVSGDDSRIAAFEVQFTNSAGTSSTGRVKF